MNLCSNYMYQLGILYRMIGLVDHYSIRHHMLHIGPMTWLRYLNYMSQQDILYTMLAQVGYYSTLHYMLYMLLVLGYRYNIQENTQCIAIYLLIR